MPTTLKHAQGLVYSLVCLMPSVYQKASLQAILAYFSMRRVMRDRHIPK